MSALASVLSGLKAPAEIVSALSRFCEQTQKSVPDVASAHLYGGLARGRYRPGRSDVNVLLLLREGSAAGLLALAPLLHSAWREFRLEPFLLVQDELPAAAVAFPSKLLDIKNHHVVLFGSDPFVTLEVSREDLRQDVRENLLNFVLRMRRRFTRIADDPRSLRDALAEGARALALELASLLSLAGQEIPSEDRTAAIFAAAATSFGLDADALQRTAALRQEDQVPPGLATLYPRVLACARQAIAALDRLH